MKMQWLDPRGMRAHRAGRWRKHLAAIVSAAVLLVACQADDSNSNTTAASQAQALQTAPASLVPESLGTPTGKTLLPGVAAISWGPDEIDIFARDSDKNVWQRTFANGAWQAWVSRGFSADGPLAAASWAAGRIDLVYRATDLRLHHRFRDVNGTWVDGGSAGASTISTERPMAAAWSAGRIDVFMRGTASSDLRHIVFLNGAWITDWVTEADTTGTVGGAPSAVSMAPGYVDVYWKASSNGQLQRWWFDGTPHAPVVLTSETLASPPAAASRFNGLLDVFFLSGSNTNTLTRSTYDRAWSSEDFSLSGAQQPAIASWGPGRLDLFYQNASGAVQHAIVPDQPVTTQHNDNERTGANLHELELNVDNVSPSTFGYLFEIPVDGNVYAQPLYVPTVDLSSSGKGIRNVLVIVTANDTIYVADADTGEILLSTHYGFAVPIPYPDFMIGGGYGSFCAYNQLPQIGITSTPVIDLVNRKIYVVSLQADAPLAAQFIPATCPGPAVPSATYRIFLRAFDLQTLNSTAATTKEITGTVSGTFTLDARHHLQRPGLLLSGGNVYVAFGSNADSDPFSGWIVSYKALTTAQPAFAAPVAKWISTPNGGGGGIWQSGQGLAADSSGNIYFLTGNGASNPSQNQYATAAVKLNSALQLQSYFMPFNKGFINVKDMDLGSGGIMLVPGTNYALGGGKESIMYLMDRTSLGGLGLIAGGGAAVADQVVYEDQVTFINQTCPPEYSFANPQYASNIHGAPVHWQSPAGRRFYVWGETDFARSYALQTTTPFFTPVAKSNARAACGMPGGFLSLSANGSVAGTGILWGTAPDGDALVSVPEGSVYAFNAETMAQLWSRPLSGDGLGGSFKRFAKNNPPTIANGRVYVPTFGPADHLAGNKNSPPYRGNITAYGLVR